MTQNEPARPSLMTRLAAALCGEVAADTVEAYRRAGRAAYEDLLNAEKLRQEMALSGTDLWSASAGQASQLLCTWNAFVLQTLGDQFVEADYQADSRTVGFLPPVTAEQAARFLGEVEQWSSHARRAAADANYDVTAEIACPARLPGWVEVEPCPRSHLAAMLAAAGAMHDHAEAALADFTRAGTPKTKEKAASRLAGLLADADSAIAYGQSMWSPTATGAVHERIESSLKRAIEGYYLTGQLLAMPRLLDRADVAAQTSAGRRLPLPGQPGFDPWCLTDPTTRGSWQQDPAARRAIDTLWRYDPDPASTLTIQAQVDGAVGSGAVSLGIDARGRRLGNYYCCPWSAIYIVQQPVMLAGRWLPPGEQFVFDVSAEEMAEGGRFKREILTGPFHPTNEVDYCDPTSD